MTTLDLRSVPEPFRHDKVYERLEPAELRVVWDPPRIPERMDDRAAGTLGFGRE